MTRSEIATRTGVGAEAVRFYEQRGLIPEPPRTAGGYRRYDASYVERIRFIKRAQELGFTLDEIQELLRLRVAPGADAGAVRQHASAKLAEVEAKLRDLERIRDALAHLVDACHGHGPTSECPILDALERGTVERTSNAAFTPRSNVQRSNVLTPTLNPTTR